MTYNAAHNKGIAKDVAENLTERLLQVSYSPLRTQRWENLTERLLEVSYSPLRTQRWKNLTERLLEVSYSPLRTQRWKNLTMRLLQVSHSPFRIQRWKIDRETPAGQLLSTLHTTFGKLDRDCCRSATLHFTHSVGIS